MPDGTTRLSWVYVEETLSHINSVDVLPAGALHSGPMARISTATSIPDDLITSETPHPVNKVTQWFGTYMGRRVEVRTAHEAGALGVRTVFTYHVDPAHDGNGGFDRGTITAHTIKGDGRKSTFAELHPRHVVATNAPRIRVG